MTTEAILFSFIGMEGSTGELEVICVKLEEKEMGEVVFVDGEDCFDVAASAFD